MTEKQEEYKVSDFIPFTGAMKYRERNVEDLDNPKIDKKSATLIVYNGIIGLTTLFTTLCGLESLLN